MAKRAMASAQPWDVGCKVTTLIGGYAAMNEMRDALEALIAVAGAPANPNPPGQRGHVYIADWRFNCQRDLSSTNAWTTGEWKGKTTSATDQTAIGLVLRLMQAGIIVRILVWYPTLVQSLPADILPHVFDHNYLWNVVKKENEGLKKKWTLTVDLGVVGLDRRTASGAVASAHHQKMLIIRSPNIKVAFCGGVDLAFSRRDAPTDPSHFIKETVLNGDWQSGVRIPDPTVIAKGVIWPPDASTDYTNAATVNPWDPSFKQGSDLPTTTISEDVCHALGGAWNGGTCTLLDGTTVPLQLVYGDSNQYWHDQHLKLEGPIVSTLEWQFAERWLDSPRMDPPVVRALNLVYDPIKTIITDNLRLGSVCFSTDLAFTLEGQIVSIHSTIVPLDTPVDITQPVGPSVVQMWRTIPMRFRTTDLFKGGEFTVMGGISKAMSTAKELIWIFDQYFWSQPAARLLNNQLRNSPTLCVLIILPPYADTKFPEVHRARQMALTELMLGLTDQQLGRVAIYDTWYPVNSDPKKGRGIYVHAKAHTYDGALLVCGSANLNRRSLTCDSELACAIVDSDLVAAHQQKLWNMLFANVAGASWPAPDFNNSTGGGIQFLAQFKAFANSGDAYLVPDPWNDDNPLNPTPKTVAIPTGVPRLAAFLGPKYEIMRGFALDPGSLAPVVESDIKNGDCLINGTAVPRPARLDDIVKRVEQASPDSPPRYNWRIQADIIKEQVFRLPSIVYYDGFHFTDQSEWWKQVCIGFPCFLGLGWPGYPTTFIDTDKRTGGPLLIDGQKVVVQLWKGWCERLGEVEGMPGGVGVEVGVYHRIPNQFAKFVNQVGGKNILQQKLTDALKGVIPNPDLPKKIQVLLDKVFNIADENLLWWPFPELNATVDFDFSFGNQSPDTLIFKAKAQKTYWRCKWMDAREWDKYAAANQAPTRLNSPSCNLRFKITGQNDFYEDTWLPNDGKVTCCLT
jgi:phosphatidylserine/phosphatidylglycerophosphate/cardiolipin synthase-like enzyme